MVFHTFLWIFFVRGIWEILRKIKNSWTIREFFVINRTILIERTKIHKLFANSFSLIEEYWSKDQKFMNREFFFINRRILKVWFRNKIKIFKAKKFERSLSVYFRARGLGELVDRGSRTVIWCGRPYDAGRSLRRCAAAAAAHRRRVSPSASAH